MYSFYTNVEQHGSNILIRGIENNKRFERKVKFYPSLYIKDLKNPTHTTLYGTPVSEIKPGTIWDCREFIKKYRDVSGFEIHGNTDFVNQYIGTNYSNKIDWNKDLIRIYSLDIECKSEKGFPEVRKASEEILLITIKDYKSKYSITWGLNPISFKIEGGEYRYFSSERSLLIDFLAFWQKNCPDIVTGWYVELFDQTYLTNRIINVLGEDSAKKLSPWGIVKSKEIDVDKKQYLKYTWFGISILDYLDLYKKFVYQKHENYKLDTIAEFELKEKKLQNPYLTFKEFYDKDWELFVKYNIKDADLIDKLEQKKSLIGIALFTAYETKTNYEDCYSPVKTWDSAIYNTLLKDNIVIPQRKNNIKEEFEAAYVKEPKPGLYNWIVTLDVSSMYPSIIMQHNISPETIVKEEKRNFDFEKLLNKEEDLSELKNNDYCVCANGTITRKDKLGIFTKLTEYYFTERKKIKKEMLRLQQLVENGDIEASKQVDELSVKEQAIKLFGNSGYGAAGEPYFRYYSLDFAEGIALTGRYLIRFIEKKLNEDLNKYFKTENKEYVIYCDTDSAIITLDNLIKKEFGEYQDLTACTNFLDRFCEEYIQPKLDLWFQEIGEYLNVYSPRIYMKREIIGNKGFWLAKKRYVINYIDKEGVRYAEPKLKVTGLEIVRSSTPKIVREKLKECVSIIVNKDQENLRLFVSNFKKEFDNLPIENVAFPRGVSDMDKHYCESNLYKKGSPMHCRGCLLFNHYLKHNNVNYLQPIKNGDKILYTYLKLPNPIKENIIAFPGLLPKEFGLENYIDYEMQFQKSFLNPLNKILGVIGWSLEDKPCLDDFFN